MNKIMFILVVLVILMTACTHKEVTVAPEPIQKPNFLQNKADCDSASVMMFETAGALCDYSFYPTPKNKATARTAVFKMVYNGTRLVVADKDEPLPRLMDGDCPEPRSDLDGEEYHAFDRLWYTRHGIMALLMEDIESKDAVISSSEYNNMMDFISKVNPAMVLQEYREDGKNFQWFLQKAAENTISGNLIYESGLLISQYPGMNRFSWYDECADKAAQVLLREKRFKTILEYEEYLNVIDEHVLYPARDSLR